MQLRSVGGLLWVLLAGCAVAGCAVDGPPQPDFSGDAAAVAALAPLGMPPAPRVHHLHYHVEYLDNRYLALEVTETPDHAVGTAEFVNLGSLTIHPGSCAETETGRMLAIGGMIQVDRFSKDDQPSCVPFDIGRETLSSIRDVSGRLFPIKLGNAAAFTENYFSSTTTGFSTNRSTITQHMQLEVTGRQDHYVIGNGQDIGEVYLIRYGATDPVTNAWLWVDEITYSTRLNWMAGFLQNSGKKSQLVSWD